MTPEQERAEARKALDNATAGPWGYQNMGSKHTPIVYDVKDENIICTSASENDGTLIANAPTWLRNSLDREEQLIAEMTLWRDKFHQLTDVVAEQDKEIQRLQRHLENIERKGYV